MIEPHTAEFWSSLLGLLGALALAFPFFMDFRARRRRIRRLDSLKKGSFSAEDAAELRKPVEKSELENVLAAERPMAGSALAGCILLVLSFVVLLLKKS